jgi:CheY-like chemotaxis protein
MTGLVNDILDYSKIESGKLQLHDTRFNMNDLLIKLEATFRTSLQDKLLTVNIEVDETLKKTVIVSDEMRIMQVMTNLLSNAIKFTERGTITIYATCLACHEDSLTIKLGVRDTGIGIREEHIGKIFESFSQADSDTTRRYGGTGLGLAISGNIVNLLQGKLHVESEYGKGSDFYFMINVPVASRKEQLKQKETISLEKIKHLKVLLAEDNPVNMIVAKKILQKWDVDITEAVNGAIAVEKFRRADFDLVLMDLEMPEMDGRNAARIIQSEKPGTPIIAFTAAFYENMETDLEEQGFAGYIPKPFRPEELYHKISAII